MKDLQRYGLEPLIVCIACLLLVTSEDYTVFLIAIGGKDRVQNAV